MVGNTLVHNQVVGELGEGDGCRLQSRRRPAQALSSPPMFLRHLESGLMGRNRFMVEAKPAAASNHPMRRFMRLSVIRLAEGESGPHHRGEAQLLVSPKTLFFGYKMVGRASVLYVSRMRTGQTYFSQNRNMTGTRYGR